MTLTGDDLLEDALDLDAHIPARLLTISSRIALHATRASAKPLGMGIREWRIIQILGSDGPSTINEVCGRIAMDFGGTSRAISALEERGLVTRSGDPDDRRISRAALTQAGRRVHRDIARFARAREERLLAALDARERAELSRLLDKLQAQSCAMLAETTSSGDA